MGYLIGFLIATFLAGYLKPINNLFTKILSAIIFSYLLFIFLITREMLNIKSHPIRMMRWLHLNRLMERIQ